MTLFKKATWVIIEFSDKSVFDYPKHLPIPNNKHKINFNGKEGVVKDVLHSISNSVSEIRIICE
jgi:hypothetical protein